MSRWAAYVESGGDFIGYVEAADRDGAFTAALGKFGDEMPCGYVREIVDVPLDIPIDPSKIRKFDAVPPAPEKRTAEEMFDNSPDTSGEEDWRDGPRDDASTDSDDILPEH